MGYLYRPKLKSGERSSVWWAKYYVNGRPVRESTGIARDSEMPPIDARRFLKEREGRAAAGKPMLPRVDRIRYDELARDFRQHYEATGRRDLDEAGYRLAHLDRFFGNMRAIDITPAEITEYVVAPGAEGGERHYQPRAGDAEPDAATRV